MAASLVIFLGLWTAAVYCQDCPVSPVPDTRCAGPVRDLRTTSVTSTSIALAWDTPGLIVGPDFHYTYRIFDPNGNAPTLPTRLPFTEQSRDMTLTVSGLKPATVYVFGITTNNEECGQNARRVDIQVKTDDSVPSPPRDVRVFCPVVVWKLPAEANGQIQGYEVQLTGALSGSLNFTKEFSESYHIVSNPDDVLVGPISIRVRAETSTGFGEYSETVTLDSLECCTPSTSSPSPTQPPTPPPTHPPTQLFTTPPTPPPTRPPVPPPTLPFTLPPPPCLINGQKCVSEPAVKFLLDGEIYYDGDTIKISNIGEGADALLCVTEYEDCCTAQTTGEFYYPDGSLVSSSSGNAMYRSQGEQLIRLNKRADVSPETGRYRCDMPDDKGVIQTIYINIVNTDPVTACPTVPPPITTTCPPPPPCPACPTSEPVETCASLSPPANGKVTTVGDKAKYICNRGYSLVGTSSRSCVSLGRTWTGTTPICEAEEVETPPPPVSCPSLPPPVNGEVTGLTTIGAAARYSCLTGYTLTGSSTRICLSSGEWSGSPPTCQVVVQCPILPNPVNGRVTILSRAIGGAAVYTCNAGFTLSGSGVRFCGSNGEWSGSQASCSQAIVPNNVRFTLRDMQLFNNSKVSLSSIGEDEGALIFSTENENCCQSQRIGECYYPDGTQVGVRASPDQLYRNRRSQTVRLNKKPSAGAGGRSASAGLYCCTVPDKEGTLQRVCADITA